MVSRLRSRILIMLETLENKILIPLRINFIKGFHLGISSYRPQHIKHFNYNIYMTTAHPWCDGYSTGISACGVWGARARVQISRREFHTHIHLD